MCRSVAPELSMVAACLCKKHESKNLACMPTSPKRLSPCVLVQPDGWARGEREGYGGPRDVTSLSLSGRGTGNPAT